MLQRYKLRLGDGTVLSVDEDELKKWQEDGRAMVQAAGTPQWRPLGELLAELESAARLARALVPPKPRQEATPASPAFGGRTSLQVLADDTGATPAGDMGSASAIDDRVPIIRMKPLDDEPSSSAAWSARYDEGEDELVEDTPRHDRLEGPLLAVLETFAVFLSRCLDPLTPLVRGWSSRSSAGSLAARPDRGTGSEPPVPRREPVRPRPQALPHRESSKAPVPISELPVLRFADADEPREAADVYEDEAAASFLEPVWRWTKRIVLIGGLATGGLIAAFSWETWFPKAADLGESVFTTIDRQARSRERAAQEQRALADATFRLPQLAPETVRLVFSASPAGVLDPAEVFQLAGDAAELGLASLTPAEAEELRTLQKELLETLRPPERQRVREYERARSRRAIFPFENPHVLELVARGARALPSPSLERLQTLYGKAVAGGLAVTTGASASQGPAR